MGAAGVRGGARGRRQTTREASLSSAHANAVAATCLSLFSASLPEIRPPPPAPRRVCVNDPNKGRPQQVHDILEVRAHAHNVLLRQRRLVVRVDPSAEHDTYRVVAAGEVRLQMLEHEQHRLAHDQLEKLKACVGGVGGGRRRDEPWPAVVQTSLHQSRRLPFASLTAKNSVQKRNSRAPMSTMAYCIEKRAGKAVV